MTSRKGRLFPNIWIEKFQIKNEDFITDEFLSSIIGILKLTFNEQTGGFSNNVSYPVYLETCQYAANLISLLMYVGENKISTFFKDKLIKHLLEYYSSDKKGFSDFVGSEPVPFATYYVVSSLYFLDALDVVLPNKNKMEDFLLSSVSDGIPCHPTLIPNITNLYWSVITAYLLDINLSEVWGDRPIEFIKECSRQDGSVAPCPFVNKGYLTYTIESELILYCYGLRDAQSIFNKNNGFIQSCKKGTYIYSERPEAIITPADSLVGNIATNLFSEKFKGENGLKSYIFKHDDLWKTYLDVNIKILVSGD